MAEFNWDPKFMEECYQSLQDIYYSLEGNVGSSDTSGKGILFSESKGYAVEEIGTFYEDLERLKEKLLKIVSSTQIYLQEATGVMVEEDRSIGSKLNP